MNPFPRLYALIVIHALIQDSALLAVGFVEYSDGNNESLIVGVGHGLEGIDIDVDNLNQLANHSAYRFKTITLEETAGTTTAISYNLTRLAEKAGATGTLFFYFSGHGNVGIIWPQDKTMHIQEIRAAVEKGRQSMGPLKRLVMMFDTCYAGSLLDPLRQLFALSFDPAVQSALFADSVIQGMVPEQREKAYWEKLLVFASSRADETSLASPDGSIYTLAMMRAFRETAQEKGSIGKFQTRSEQYTDDHHPVARFVPASLKQERLVE